MMTNIKVALLGLGTMGQGMARNLLKAGFPLTVYNRTRSKAELLGKDGALVVDTPGAAAATADVVLAMLADDTASRAAWLDPKGALAAMRPGGVVIECSTLSPDWVSKLDDAARGRGLRMVEAPVTGSRPQAEGGQLKFLVGADTETLEKVAPVLRSMGKEVLHLGTVGSGAQLKLINNYLAAVQAASFAEALAWIERTSLNRETALDFLKKAAPASGILNAMADRMTERTYEVNFLLRLMTKDLRYAHAAAAERGVELSMAETAEVMFRKAQEQGYGERDMSAVVEVVRQSQPQ
jgi:3-hydroxyisobutyrate dehydrogenase